MGIIIKQEDMKKEVFKIQGMTCASCARTIEKAVSSLAGVTSAQVNFGAETLLVEYDEEKVSPEDMAKATKDVGYQLLVPEDKEGKSFLSLKVVGMDSPHCAMVVEKAIKTLPGIEKAEVDYNNTRVKIIFDSGKVRESQIKKVIEDKGYICENVDETKNQSKQKTNWLNWIFAGIG